MRALVFLLLFATSAIAKPTLWIIGDSTVRNSTRDQQGWGDPLIKEFSPLEIKVVNKAIGGRSSRTFLTEGRWDAIMEELDEGDYVIMQFGHNDGGKMFEGDRPRASIKGNNDKSESGVVEATGKEETVHSYGWYIRKYCEDAKSKGATPIVLSLIPRNRRDGDGDIVTADKDYGRWAKQAAKQADAHFIDFNAVLAKKWDRMDEEEVDALFCGTDHTHTSPKGAEYCAKILAEEIRELEDCDLGDHLRD